MKMIKYALTSTLLAAGFLSVTSANADTVANLDDWSGDWISATTLIQTPKIDKELTKTYEELGKKEGISTEEWKANKLKAWDSSAVKSMKITSDKIDITLKDGKEIKNTYKYKGEVEMPYENGKTLKWHAFEASADNDYKYMAFRPSGKTENLSHFHFRNSGQSFDQLKELNVFRTMVSPKTTADQLGGDFKE